MRKLVSYMRATNEGAREMQAVKHDPDALVALLERTSAEGAPADVQVMVVMATHRHGDSAVVMDALERVLRHSEHAGVRSAVAAALGEIANERAVELLHLAEADSSKQVRDNAAYSLRGLRTGKLPITARK